ncbi:hypothetical protein DA717_11245 [Piscirickettsiaceae bacterium NZ-RLO2]|nr:hypothetical protein DA717_11245 [Piscirickettsiaceae bacterium NZ-RLO2]
MNDKSELDYAKEVISYFIDSEIAKRTSEFETNSIKKSAKACFDKVIYLPLGDDFYITSFCNHHTTNNYYTPQLDGLLSMWKSYGDGVALVIDVKQLFLGIDKLVTNTQIPMIYGKVSYLNHLQPGAISEHIREKLLQSVFKVCDAYIELVLKDNKKYLCSIDIDEDLLKPCLETMCLIKHYGFHQEEEARIMFISRGRDLTTGQPKVGEPFIQEYNDCTGKKYIQIPFDFSLCVKEVIVSPGEKQQFINNKIRCILNKHGFEDIKVIKSTIPHR